MFYRCIPIYLPYQFSLGLRPHIPSFCFMDKARGRLVLSCCLIGLMEDSSLSPCHYRLILLSGSRFQLLPADLSEYFLRIVVFFLFRKRMDQR